MFRFDQNSVGEKFYNQIGEERTRNLIQLVTNYLIENPECIKCGMFLNINEYVRIYSGVFCAANKRAGGDPVQQQGFNFEPPTDFEKKYGRKICKTFIQIY